MKLRSIIALSFLILTVFAAILGSLQPDVETQAANDDWSIFAVWNAGAEPGGVEAIPPHLLEVYAPDDGLIAPRPLQPMGIPSVRGAVEVGELTKR
ncbi:hypothetical protein [Paludisphaera rhizosphaerae]|uniref:hypothetical protein n=1 Tax=Paludisphaera rhizosphaerae TaxID=2711216 RepID=UPI0013EDD795|nr:hypothetical protein [Paludisphaera rhizosphaerae]